MSSAQEQLTARPTAATGESRGARVGHFLVVLVLSLLLAGTAVTFSENTTSLFLQEPDGSEFCTDDDSDGHCEWDETDHSAFAKAQKAYHFGVGGVLLGFAGFFFTIAAMSRRREMPTALTAGSLMAGIASLAHGAYELSWIMAALGEWVMSGLILLVVVALIFFMAQWKPRKTKA